MAVFVIGALCILLWFRIPYSPLKAQFLKENEEIKKELFINNSEVFKESDFSSLPVLIQKYIKTCGYIGKKKMNRMKMMYCDVDFSQSKKGPNLKINYTQYNYAKKPIRMALIESFMFGIPFQGYDSYYKGMGGMKGVLAKGVPLFDQRGKEMDQACLATYLAECLFIPSALLDNSIAWETLNENQVKATIQNGEQKASGIFTFNKDYEMISFTTLDRAVIDNQGKVEYIPWSAVCKDYVAGKEGIKHPTTFQAVWNYEDGDFVYFDGKIKDIKYE